MTILAKIFNLRPIFHFRRIQKSDNTGFCSCLQSATAFKTKLSNYNQTYTVTQDDNNRDRRHHYTSFRTDDNNRKLLTEQRVLFNDKWILQAREFSKYVSNDQILIKKLPDTMVTEKNIAKITMLVFGVEPIMSDVTMQITENEEGVKENHYNGQTLTFLHQGAFWGHQSKDSSSYTVRIWAPYESDEIFMKKPKFGDTDYFEGEVLEIFIDKVRSYGRTKVRQAIGIDPENDPDIPALRVIFKFDNSGCH